MSEKLCPVCGCTTTRSKFCSDACFLQNRRERQSEYYKVNKEWILQKQKLAYSLKPKEPRYCSTCCTSLTSLVALYCSSCARKRKNKGNLRYMVGYYAKNKSRIQEYLKSYYEDNKEVLLENMRTYSKENPVISKACKQRHRALKRGATGSFTAEQIQARFDYFDNECRYCSKDLSEEVTTIDHMIPLSRGGTNWPSNLVPACASCNSRKGDKTYFEFCKYLAA